jgi:hypothetical protein
MKLLFIEVDGGFKYYYEDQINPLQDLLERWKDNVLARRKYQRTNTYEIFEGFIYPVYNNPTYKLFRKREMELFCEIIDKADSLNITNAFEEYDYILQLDKDEFIVHNDHADYLLPKDLYNPIPDSLHIL